jgi:hypothetical protein
MVVVASKPDIIVFVSEPVHINSAFWSLSRWSEFEGLYTVAKKMYALHVVQSTRTVNKTCTK